MCCNTFVAKQILAVLLGSDQLKEDDIISLTDIHNFCTGLAGVITGYCFFDFESESIESSALKMQWACDWNPYKQTVRKKADVALNRNYYTAAFSAKTAYLINSYADYFIQKLLSDAGRQSLLNSDLKVS